MVQGPWWKRKPLLLPHVSKHTPAEKKKNAASTDAAATYVAATATITARQ